MPRYAGPSTLFRLPTASIGDPVDISIAGAGLDIGTSNRPGSRFGPRQIRSESSLVRPYAMATGAAPFDSFQVANVGDVALNSFNLTASIRIIHAFYCRLLQSATKPMALGGDDTITLPILRTLHEQGGALVLIHVDAHADTNDAMFGERIAHGTIFHRAIEEKLADPQRMVQIGLRATGYSPDDFNRARDQGVRVVTAEEWLPGTITILDLSESTNSCPRRVRKSSASLY